MASVTVRGAHHLAFFVLLELLAVTADPALASKMKNQPVRELEP